MGLRHPCNEYSLELPQGLGWREEGANVVGVRMHAWCEAMAIVGEYLKPLSLAEAADEGLLGLLYVQRPGLHFLQARVRL
jgi:hypothetical protein